MKLDMQTVALMRKAVPYMVRNEGRPGTLGRVDGTLAVTLPDGTEDRRRVWARVQYEGVVTEVVCWANGIARILNLPVRIADVGSDPWIIGPNGVAAGNMTEGRELLEMHAWQHGRYGPDPLYITGLMFVPLLVRPATTPDMTVYVEPGWYRYEGTWNKWEGGSTADLTSYRPSVSNTTHFVIVTLDRENNELVVVDGADVAADDVWSTPDVAASDVKAITVADAYYPLAVVELTSAQTAIRPHSISQDLRLWGMEVRSTDSAIDSIMTDADAEIMVDANGNVMVET